MRVLLSRNSFDIGYRLQTLFISHWYWILDSLFSAFLQRMCMRSYNGVTVVCRTMEHVLDASGVHGLWAMVNVTLGEGIIHPD